MSAFLGSMILMGFFIQYAALGGALQFVDATASRLDQPQLEATGKAAISPSVGLDSKILEDILARLDTDETTAAANLTLAYEGVSVAPGEFVHMEDAANPPTARIHGGDDEVSYVWMLVDIDAPDPSHPDHSPFLHYIVSNVGASAPKTIVPYYPITPPVGKHRYVSMLFRASREMGSVHVPHEKWSKNRSSFDVVGFARDHDLHLVSLTHFVSKPTQP